MHSSARRAVMAAMAALIAGCGASPESRLSAEKPTSKVDAGATAPSPPLHPTSPIAGLGDFAELPQGSLPEPVAASLQAVLDGAVEQGTFRGATAGVIVADWGSWSGATGDDLEGNPLTPDAQLLLASVGKTVSGPSWTPSGSSHNLRFSGSNTLVAVSSTGVTASYRAGSMCPWLGAPRGPAGSPS